MRGTRVLLALGLALGTSWAAPAEAAPAAPRFAPAGSIGHDVSYPQCDKPLPVGAFGVVGVNGGKNFTANRCLAAQYAWAKTLPNQAMVYLNTGNPGNQSTNWPLSATSEGGALCINAASAADPGCAYIYGRRVAASAMQVAAGAGVALDTTWWLDVETANSWDGDGVGNAAELQGMFDYLRGSGVAQVGLYSTGLQWGEITGGYSGATAADYRTAWSTYFTPKYAMETAPNWIAGVTAVAAARNCLTTFTGGPTALAQYIEAGFDHNLVCGAVTPTPANWKACLPGAGIPAGYLAVYGTRGNDVLKGTKAREILYGGPGRDVIKGGRGDDILCGGPGKDKLIGATGNDVLVGDDGNDQLFGGAGRDHLYGNKGKDTLDGGKNRDSCSTGGGDDPKPIKCP